MGSLLNWMKNIFIHLKRVCGIKKQYFVAYWVELTEATAIQDTVIYVGYKDISKEFAGAEKSLTLKLPVANLYVYTHTRVRSCYQYGEGSAINASLLLSWKRRWSFSENRSLCKTWKKKWCERHLLAESLYFKIQYYWRTLYNCTIIARFSRVDRMCWLSSIKKKNVLYYPSDKL